MQTKLTVAKQPGSSLVVELYNESQIWLHGTFPRFRIVVLGKMMENDSEFEQSYESDDSQYNFIPGYETEVEERR